MSITPDDIADSLDDVDEDEIEKRLAESDCFLYSLAKAIVAVRCYKADAANLATALSACLDKAGDIQQQLADQEAKEKDNARRFQAPMVDDDWDEMKMRMMA